MFGFFRNLCGTRKTNDTSLPTTAKRHRTNSISIVKTLLIFSALVAAATFPGLVVAESKTNTKDKPLPKPHPLCGGTNPKDQPCVAVEVKLPTGCKNYKIIKGNPATAKTLLLGESHETCREAASKCKNALIEQRLAKTDFEATIAVLYESAAHNQHLSCEEMHADQVDNCRGWNGPRADYPLKTIDYLYGANDLIKDLQPKLDAILNLPAHLKKSKTIAMLKKAKHDYEGERDGYARSHAALFKRFKPTHPDVNFKDFHSDEITFSNKRIYFIERIQKLLDKINAGVTPLQIYNELVNEYNALFDVAKQYDADAQSVQIPNRYMLSAIKVANTENDVVILGTGFKHLDGPLFANLDAAKISYAALNCTLG